MPLSLPSELQESVRSLFTYVEGLWVPVSALPVRRRVMQSDEYEKRLTEAMTPKSSDYSVRKSMRSDTGSWFGLGLIIGTIALIIALTTCGSAYAGEDTRPSWCAPDYVCLTTKEAATLLIKVELLEKQVDVLKAKRMSRLGFAAVCGPAASLSTTDGNTTLAGTLSCVIGAGYRF